MLTCEMYAWLLLLINLSLFIKITAQRNFLPLDFKVNLNSQDELEVYQMMETEYLYKCPYRNPKFALTNFSSNKQFWLAKMDSQYGYFEDRTQFNTILTAVSIQMAQGDCVYQVTYQTMLFVNLSNCTRENVYGLCVYHPESEDFCSNYHTICKEDCDGMSKYKSQFACGAVFNDKGMNCERCDEAFENYPEPTIRIFRDGCSGIAVVIRNYYKAAADYDKDVGMRFTNVECIYGMSGHNLSRVKEVIKADNFSQRELYEDDTEVVYISLLEDSFSVYCQIFVYPDLVPLISNELVIASEDDYHFIANTTAEVKVPGIPFTIHVDQQRALRNIINTLQISFMAHLFYIYPSDDDDKGHITPTFHLYANRHSCTIKDCYQSLSMALPVTYSLASSQYCFEESTISNDKTLTWPRTLVGTIALTDEVVVTKAGLPLTRYCGGSFKQGAVWSRFTFDPNSITNLSTITKQLYEILMDHHLSADQINSRVLEVIDGSPDIIPYDVYLIAKCLEKSINLGEHYNIENAINIVEITMDFDRPILYQSQINLNATDMLLYSYDMILMDQADHQVPALIYGNKTVGQILPVDGSLNGLAVYRTQSDGIMVKSLNVDHVDDIDKIDLILASFLPKASLNEIKNRSINSSLVSSVFLNNNLFNDAEHRPNWQVMNVFVTHTTSHFISNKLQIIFGERYEKLIDNQTCGYWHYGISDQLVSIFGRWKEDGTLNNRASNYKICEFDHMTHFALFFDAPENRELNTVTIIMTVISFVSIFLIFLTAICFKHWRREESVKVLLNYSATIMIQDVLILIFDLMHISNTFFCTTYGVLMHFSILAQFLWMLIIMHVQYQRLVQTFHSSRNSNLTNFIVLAWTIPFVPIIIILCINVRSYKNATLCFLQDLNLYIGIFLPISLIVAVIILILIRIAIFLFRNTITAVGISLLKQKIIVCVLLVFLSGITWTFGLLANATQSIVPSYLSCVLVIGQGLLLWVYFVMTRKEVTILYAKRMRSILEIPGYKIPRPTCNKLKQQQNSENHSSENETSTTNK